MSRRHVLVVAWWFPPLSGGGVHRPLQFVRHLARRGFDVTVLTGVPPSGERQDAGLLAKVPPEVRVLRVPLLDPFRLWAKLKPKRGVASTAAPTPPKPASSVASAAAHAASPRWRDLVTEAIALPDRWLPWIAPAVARAAVALRGREPELVFSTSPPHSMHLVGRALAGLLSAPHVVDFRDPWTGNPFRRYAAPWFRELDASLERTVVASAAQVVLNTPALERQFRQRYPAVARARTIPNGFDPDAFAGLPPRGGSRRPGIIEIAHFGQLYGLRSGRPLLEGLALVKRDAPDVFAKLRVAFIGSIDGEPAFRALAESLGVAAAIEIPGALPHGESLARQRQSDVLLLLGPENREPEIQVPGKLYEYFAAGRPILTLSRRGGAIAEILDQAGVAHERAEPDDPAAIAAALIRITSSALPTAAARDAGGADRFRYDRLADELIACFDDAWRRE